MLFGQRNFFSLNFFFKLIDLMINNFVSSFQLGYLILGFGQTFAVSIPVWSNIFVELLLLLKLVFCFNVLFLILRNEVSFKLDLLESLQIFCICHCCLFSITLLFLLDLENLFIEVLDGKISLRYLFLIVYNLLFSKNKFFGVLFELGLELEQLLLKVVPFFV